MFIIYYYFYMGEYFSQVNLLEYVVNFCSNLEAFYWLGDKIIMLYQEVFNLLFDVFVMILFGLIFNEFLINVYKYVFEGL